MLLFLLFETRIGDWLLGLLERWLGLAVVPVELVEGMQASGLYHNWGGMSGDGQNGERQCL